MQKTLFFKSSHTKHFVEVRNDNSVPTTYKVYFNNGNTNLFRIENHDISDYPSFDNGYTITVDAYNSAYLEISPKCDNFDIDASVDCYVKSIDNLQVDVFKLALSVRKERYSKGFTKYLNLSKTYSSFEKENQDTFHMGSINPSLTGNIKIKVNSGGEVFLSAIENLQGLTDERLFNRRIKKGSNLVKEMYLLSKDLQRQKDTFYQNLSNFEFNNDTVVPYNEQRLDDVYKSGAKLYPSKYYQEKIAISAPLYLLNRIPRWFVVFRKDTFIDVGGKQSFKDLKIVKTFDLREDTQLGTFLKNSKEYENFEKSHIYLDLAPDKAILETTGIEINESVISTKYEDISSYIFDEEKPVSEFETFVTNSFQRNGLVSHKIFNLEFLLDDDSLDSMATYFGMYCDELDLETFDINIDSYGQSEVVSSLRNVSSTQTKLYTTSTKAIDNKYINNGDRIFYVKDPSDNFHFINSIDSGSGYNVFDVGSFSLNNFVCKSNSVVVNENDVKDDLKPYINLDFVNNLNDGDCIELVDGDVKYVIKTSTETDIISLNPITLPKTSKVASTSLESDYQLKIDGIYDIPDNHELLIIDDLDNSSTQKVSTVSYDGESTILSFDDSINISSTMYVDFSLDGCQVINTELGTTLVQTLNSISESINNSNYPFTSSVYANGTGYTLNICFNSNRVFKVNLNYSNTTSNLSDVSYFGNDITTTTTTLGGSSYTSGFTSFNSTYPPIPGQRFFKVSKDEITDVSGKSLVSSGEVINFDVHNEELGRQVLDETGDNYLFRIKDHARPNESLELFDLCTSSVGLFSFYDIKDYDLNRITVDDNYLTSEYSQIYTKPREFEPLKPATFYRVKNGSQDTRLVLNVLYGVAGSFNFEVVDTIKLSPNTESFFTTFASFYDKEIFKSNGEFRYQIESGDTFEVSQYFLVDDNNLTNFIPTYSANSLNVIGLQNLANELALNKDPNYVKLFRARSEYNRLMENKPLEGNFRGFVSQDFVKWESYTSMDSKGENLRFNVSPAFGKTSYTSHFSNYDTNTEAHSHEWFILEDFPSDIKAYEKSQAIYGFDKIDRSLLLDITNNYFDEYFEAGFPNITRESNYIPFRWNSNYSKLVNTSTNEYEAFFKGVRYRFNSDDNLSDYKFSVVASTKPGVSDVSSPFETHCVSESISYNCNVQGIIPELKDAVDKLIASDNTLNLNVSIVFEGSPVHLDGNFVGTSLPLITPNATTNEFKEEINSAIQEWVTLIEKVYSKEEGQESDLTINYSLNEEVGPYPVVQNYITTEQKSEFNIGNIRIVLADINNSDFVAETVYISTSVYDSEIEYLTPTIILNANKFFRRDAQGSNLGAYSIKYVVAHEFGHVLGLGHTLKEDSIMHRGVKTTYTFSERFPNGLYPRIDGTCLKEVYGELIDDLVAPAQTFDCDSNLLEFPDNWEFIINEKYKTIVLKIYVNMDTYITLDSKKSFLDIYLSKDSKRIRYSDEDGFIPTMEPADVRVPNIDLSLGGVEFFNEKISADFINDYEDELNDDNLGVLPDNSPYRIRNYKDNDKNYQISYGTLTNEDNFYIFNKSYDDDGNLNRTLIGQVKDTGNIAVDLSVPFNTLTDFKNSVFWRISGGEAFDKWNSRLSLDYTARLLPTIKQTTVKEDGSFTSDRKFEVDMVPPNVIKIKNTKYLENTDNGIVTQNAETRYNLFRHSVSFDPKFQSIITFGVREDYDFSQDMGIDFFKCNTRFLHENPNYGKKREFHKKVSEQNLIEVDTETTLTSSNSPIYERINSVFDSPLNSDWYRVYTSGVVYDKISGFKEPDFKRNLISSIIPKVEDSHTLNVKSENVIFTKTNNNLVITVDLETTIVEGLKDYYRNLYSKIYIGDASELENSLESFVKNVVRDSYILNRIEYYENQASTTTYTTDTTGFIVDKNVRSNRSGDDLIINKTVKTDVTFGLKLKFNFI